MSKLLYPADHVIAKVIPLEKFAKAPPYTKLVSNTVLHVFIL